MNNFPPVNEQMSMLMRGVDFGDEQTRVNMEKEFSSAGRREQQERETSARLLRVRSLSARPAPGPHHSHAQVAPVSGPGS